MARFTPILQSFLLAVACLQTAGWAIGADQDAPALRRPWPERAVDHGLSSGNFQVRSDCGPVLTQRLLDRVHMTRSVFAPVFEGLRVQRPGPRSLLVFDDPAEMSFTVSKAFGAAHVGQTALFFEGRSGNIQHLAVARVQPSSYGGSRSLQAAAFQQYAHPRFAGILPPWAMVGLTEYAGAIQFDGRQPGVGHAPPEFIELIERADKYDQLIPVHRLLSLDDAGWAQYERSQGSALLRAQAWALVHFMLHDDSGVLADRFGIWLERVTLREDPVATLRELLGIPGDQPMDHAAFESAFRQHHRALESSARMLLWERVELIRAILEQLEVEGMRPASRLSFMDHVRSHGSISVSLFDHPYERTLQSDQRGILDGIAMTFVPANQAGDSEPTPPADLIVGLEGREDAGTMRISWWDDGDGRWIPYIE